MTGSCSLVPLDRSILIFFKFDSLLGVNTLVFGIWGQSLMGLVTVCQPLRARHRLAVLARWHLAAPGSVAMARMALLEDQLPLSPLNVFPAE